MFSVWEQVQLPVPIPMVINMKNGITQLIYPVFKLTKFTKKSAQNIQTSIPKY